MKGFHSNYPGIYVPVGKTLTIKGGTGILNASSNSNGGETYLNQNPLVFEPYTK